MEQDYEECVKWYKKAAEQADPNAFFWLGCCYANAWGVTKNFKKAVENYTLSVEIDQNSSAQHNLGVCYFYGDGVEQDLEKAWNW